MIHYPIGEIFKEMGVVAEEQLAAALHVHHASDAKLGEVLMKLNFVTESELARAIALQNELEYVELESWVPEREALELVDREFAQLNTLLPLKLEHGTLLVATASPDEEIRAYLAEATSKPVRFCVAAASDIARYAELRYEELEESIESKIERLAVEADGKSEIDVIELAELILNNAVKERATDIHLVPERLSSHVFYRIDGVLNHYFSLPNALHPHLILRLKVLADLDIVENLKPQSGEFGYNFLRTDFNIRLSVIPTLKGEKAALRLLPENFMLYGIESLGFETETVAALERIAAKNSGIVLVTGSSGSGKTTTLYALLRKINILERNVISIEEPVEFQLPFVNQLEVNPATGFTFEKGLRHIARQDPDVIVVGEILDRETAQLAVRNSATGHLILSTVSGNRPVSTVTRLKDFDVDIHLLADGLVAVLSQKLVRRLCPHCKQSVTVDSDSLKAAFPGSELPKGENTLYRAGGCDRCKGSGYFGRMAIAELLEIDDKIREMIEEGQSVRQIEQYAIEQGMKRFEDDALQKALRGETSLEELMRVLG